MPAVYDEATIPWVTDEIAYARSLMSLGVPVLGICFGGQLLAAAVGGTAARAAIPEIGWVTVSTDVPALSEPGPWLAWHGAAARASRLVRVLVSDIARRPVAPLRAAVPG